MGGKRQGFTQKQSAQFSFDLSINCKVNSLTGRAAALQKREQQITEKKPTTTKKTGYSS
jgi:hypothetical protein